ncbi:MAG TPA: hypothetical protein VKG26_06460 [Bacteroidia bacterium]|nr:hypothetical protein [Bacteroidia bacterium]
MRICFILVLVAQLGTAQIMDIPEGVRYKPTTDKVNQKAEQLLRKELGPKPSYKLFNIMLCIGPALWDIYKEDTALSNIEGGNLQLQEPVYDKNHKQIDTIIKIGKFIQAKPDFKKVWDRLRKECDGQELIFRKFKRDELTYFWSVIPYDIEEPVFIVETKLHTYIIDIDNNKLVWLDAIR